MYKRKKEKDNKGDPSEPKKGLQNANGAATKQGSFTGRVESSPSHCRLELDSVMAGSKSTEPIF